MDSQELLDAAVKRHAITIDDADIIDINEDAPIGVKRFGVRDDSGNRLQRLVKGRTVQDIASLCASDLNFLSKFLMPDVCTMDWPDLMVANWNMVVSGLWDLQKFIGHAKYVWGIPRGFAKTTLVKLLVCYCILYTRSTFILIISSIESNSYEILKDIIDTLDQDQVRQVFGNYDERMINDSRDYKRFKFLGKDIILKGKGQGTSLRGINVGNRRPEVIIPEDAQNEENAKSPVESANYITWFTSTLMLCGSPDGLLVLYVGNTYAYDGALIKTLMEDKEWVSMTLGAIRKDGTSLWPERHPVVKLLSEYATAKALGRGNHWVAQMMNDTDVDLFSVFDAGLASGIFHGKYPNGSWPILAKFLVIDPAGFRKNSDKIAMLEGHLVSPTVTMARQGLTGRYNPKENIEVAIDWALEHNLPYIFVEDVAYQQTLLFWFDYFLKLKNITWIQVIPISPERSKKNSRISSMFEQVHVGAIIIHDDLWDDFKTEAIKFDPSKTTNTDDLLDVTHYLPKIARISYQFFKENYASALAASVSGNRRLGRTQHLDKLPNHALQKRSAI